MYNPEPDRPKAGLRIRSNISPNESCWGDTGNSVVSLSTNAGLWMRSQGMACRRGTEACDTAETGLRGNVGAEGITLLHGNSRELSHLPSLHGVKKTHYRCQELIISIHT